MKNHTALSASDSDEATTSPSPPPIPPLIDNKMQFLVTDLGHNISALLEGFETVERVIQVERQELKARQRRGENKTDIREDEGELIEFVERLRDEINRLNDELEEITERNGWQKALIGGWFYNRVDGTSTGPDLRPRQD